MVQTIQAKEITLLDLENSFGLQLVEDEQFFREWQENLPEITDTEKKQLDRVKASYANLLKYPPLLENTVKMVVLSPLLDLADFYLSPFHVKSEKSVEVTADDEGVTVKGQIDVLILFEQLVVVVIESKQAAFSVEVGKAQLLAYMLALSNTDKPIYGLITNGGSFIFVKLVKQETPKYALSRLFYIFNPGNELYTVLRVLKRLGKLAINGS
ncbi:MULTISPECIES: restriction endonuclease subunit R [Nostoc]|uniref:Restriction endonuclease subunit R n=1 Tax=Nostoc paludosum FACHB-159 TaxID=2692908 RepID=A0ABR8K6W4_9NOSO|nr:MULTISPECIES: restriction endonuclease subunit R [Nostoc]MBD2679606.1 restriction endonuclease subunit R [Nostoc sp. FACHB-857]MBD2735200.1 restriction endonuclease subunit R [Nostoc paludosum FACHB-159]